MLTVTYKPAEVLHWFGIGSRQARQRARRKSQAALSGNDFAQGIRDVAGAAAELGKGALSDIVQRRAEDTTYQFFEDAFEVNGITSRRRIPYEDVTGIEALTHDRFELHHKGGALMIKPIAHLVAGRLRVPVGWSRNGMEVPYATLIEELAARCGVEIVAE
ncbi:MAG: hypothetical protein JSS66_04550 [Armatimonadetes bacterium]|nr:hypothetical protein [Armatimonadota bacterium]